MERHYLNYKNAQLQKKADFDQLYERHEKLGSGGFGEVYAGLHRQSGVPCAIKIIDKVKM